MNTSTSPSSSSPSSSEECESGWTLYLQHDSTQFITTNCNNNSRNLNLMKKKKKKIDCNDNFYDYDDDHADEDEEVDLSMVSDASSGPPHLEEEEEEAAEEHSCYGGGRKRGTSSPIGSSVKLGRRRFEVDDFALDDTASSHPIMNMIFSSKGNGGHHVHSIENQTASSMKSVIDYSSQGFSATHFEVVVVESRKRR